MADVLDLARQLAEEVLAPAATETDLSGRIPAAHFDALTASGFYGLSGPASSGGLGVDRATSHRVIEILASGCLSTAFVLLQHVGAVRAIASYGDERIAEQWLRPLCEGKRRAGLALAGATGRQIPDVRSADASPQTARPGPPMLRARPVGGGYVFDGFSPWVTGWGMVDTLYTAARDEQDNVIWAILDAGPDGELVVEPLELAAVMASQTVEVYWKKRFVPLDRLVHRMPFSEWQRADAGALRSNGSLALGLAGRCCTMIGPSALDDELVRVRERLDAATPETMPAARAAASELALRAAAAVIAARGSQSILTSADPQRLAREAMFLLVFGSRPAIKKELLGLLAGPA